MIFVNECVRLVNVRKFKSKAGNECTFLTIADPTTYENCDLMPVRDFDISRLESGKDYKAIIHYDGRYTNVELLPVKG